MSIYEELKSIPDQREQFAFKGKGEHISEVNIPNITYPTNISMLQYQLFQENILMCQIL